MYRHSLSTKAERLSAREASLAVAQECGATITRHEGADAISVIHQYAAHYTLTIYNGTAYKPTAHYAFRALEALETRLSEYTANRIASQARKAEKRKTRPPSDHAATAAAIRRHLARTFPGVKFSVTSDSFANGDSVSIRWTDGPTAHLVDDIVKPYQHGSFDSMADCYEHRTIDPALGCPGAKYVTTGRKMSHARQAEIEQAALAAHGSQLPLNLWGREFCPVRYEADHPELLGGRMPPGK